jgi:hypothetical protein
VVRDDRLRTLENVQVRSHLSWSFIITSRRRGGTERNMLGAGRMAQTVWLGLLLASFGGMMAHSQSLTPPPPTFYRPTVRKPTFSRHDGQGLVFSQLALCRRYIANDRVKRISTCWHLNSGSTGGCMSTLATGVSKLNEGPHVRGTGVGRRRWRRYSCRHHSRALQWLLISTVK